MELSTTPDIYNPNIGLDGEYTDYIPKFNILNNGITCPCNSKKEKVFKTSGQFSTHIKTKMHKSWLLSLNNNKNNHYIEAEKYKKIINSQKIIIAKLDIENKTKSKMIETLIEQLAEYSVSNVEKTEYFYCKDINNINNNIEIENDNVNEVNYLLEKDN